MTSANLQRWDKKCFDMLMMFLSFFSLKSNVLNFSLNIIRFCFINMNISSPIQIISVAPSAPCCENVLSASVVDFLQPPK
jgi:hypothetical protein